jgi:hypothetical protein
MKWPTFDNVSQNYMSFVAPPEVRQTLIEREKLELFANWFDLHQQSNLQDPDDPSFFKAPPPSLSEMLGFDRPGFVLPLPSVDNNLVRTGKSSSGGDVTHGPQRGTVKALLQSSNAPRSAATGNRKEKRDQDSSPAGPGTPSGNGIPSQFRF